MLTETQDSRYFERMKSSLNDKTRILDFVIDGKILDVGAGEGSLSAVMSELYSTVYSLDGSEAAVDSMKKNYNLKNIIQGFSYEAKQIFNEEFFDTIVCSSIIHEIYSYGSPETGKLSIRSVLNDLKSFYDLLKPGGRLIIRDGVMPTDFNKKVRINLKTESSIKFFEEYSKRAPFWNDKPMLRNVFLTRDGDTLEGNFSSAMEFLYTLTWGIKSIERESQEYYGVFTEYHYKKVLEDLGFTIDHSEQYLQEGYITHLSPHVELKDSNNNVLQLPSSNMLIVARK